MEKSKQSSKKKEEPKTDVKRIALVRVRGKVHLREDIQETLRHLNLHAVNHCIVIDNREQYRGMINKVNDYVTWGEIDEKTFQKLIAERGRTTGNKKLADEYLKEKTKYKTVKEFADSFMKFNAELKEIPEIKPVFRLSPPVKGHARKGIKKPYTLGGTLGYRGKEINQLIERMI